MLHTRKKAKILQHIMTARQENTASDTNVGKAIDTVHDGPAQVPVVIQTLTLDKLFLLEGVIRRRVNNISSLGILHNLDP